MHRVSKLKSLSDQLYEYLTQSIVEGKFEPGKKLVEKELCEQFAISRSPIPRVQDRMMMTTTMLINSIGRHMSLSPLRFVAVPGLIC